MGDLEGGFTNDAYNNLDTARTGTAGVAEQSHHDHVPHPLVSHSGSQVLYWVNTELSAVTL